MKECTLQDLPQGQRELLLAAEKAAMNSYSPYSGFKVGAALLASSGEMFTGTNVENAGYSPTICAERAAIVSACSSGVQDFQAIAVISPSSGDTVGSPCGVCRQVLSEFSKDGDITVILSNATKSRIIITSVAELLPLPFRL
ncbi:MAG: cytidine deaminase [Candidatus Dadabacteria bacterium]|nr:MAG: cytidine deaminase [Candidatus Dadabacteria bacterium]